MESSRRSKQKRSAFVSWWQRQNTAIKTAVIAGIFGMVSAICGLLGSSISPIIDYFSVRTSPTVFTKIIFEDFNWMNGIYAYDPLDTKEEYSIVTGTCLEIYNNEGVLNRTDRFIPHTASTQQLEGSIGILLTTDKPIVVQQIELRVSEFVPVNNQISYPVSWIIGGGEEGPVNEILLDPVEILPATETYEILKSQQYQLPGEGAVTLTVPVRFQTPGTYTIHFVIQANSYGSELPAIKIDSFTIKWLHRDTIDTIEVHLPKDLSDTYGNIGVRLCP